MKKRWISFFAALVLLCALTVMFAFAQQDLSAYAVLYQNDGAWETRIVTVVNIPDQIFADCPCEPEVTVLFDDASLVEDADYTVSYFENDRPGAAFARVTFFGAYYGYIDVPFDIVSDEPVQTVVQPIPDQFYTGAEIEPDPVVTRGETVLLRGWDYTVSYNSNVNAGTAEALITLFGGEGEQTLCVPFQILPRSASELTANEISTPNYTGKQVCPEILFSFFDVPLEEGFDYELTFSDNIEPGTATATAVFFGNFTGERTVSFSVAFGAQTEFTAEAESNNVSLSWLAPFGATSYRLYRYDPETKAYVQLCHTKATSFEDRNLQQLTDYRYKLVCYAKGEMQTLRSPAHKATASVGLKTPNLALKTLNKKVKLAWTKNELADGYLVYRYDASTGKQKKIAKITDVSERSFIDRGVKNGVHYEYFVRSYKKISGKNVFSSFTERKDSLSPAALLAGLKKQALTSYPIYNVQGKTTRYLSSVTLSKDDLAILDAFAKEHFQPKWTDEQKLRYTLEWINSEVYYPFGKVFDEICQYSHVKAIFQYKKGQCLQYNGAMCAMMTYLGYPSRLIMGYRGTYGDNHFQHFWCETTINETLFVLETGNAGRNGSWMYFFRPYSETSGYIKNRKNVS